MAWIATRAHGVATRGQLLAAGMTRHEIQWRLGTGALLPVHKGVYRVGHNAPITESSYLAGVLACGAGAVLGGRAAGFNFGLVKGEAPGPEVIAPTERRVPGVRCRRSRLDRRDLTTWRDIPTLTVPATLVDLAGLLTEGELARACHEAGVRYRTSPHQVDSVLGRRPNAAGAATLKRVLGGDTPVSLSRLESRFVELLRENRLPIPVLNRPAGGRRVDCRWPRHRLTVEPDSFRFHRYTWGDVFESPAQTLAELSCLRPTESAKDRTATRNG